MSLCATCQYLVLLVSGTSILLWFDLCMQCQLLVCVTCIVSDSGNDSYEVFSILLLAVLMVMTSVHLSVCLNHVFVSVCICFSSSIHCYNSLYFIISESDASLLYYGCQSG